MRILSLIIRTIRIGIINACLWIACKLGTSIKYVDINEVHAK